MPNSFFQFKQFIVHHDRCAMKVTTDACLFGAWAAKEIQQSEENIKSVLDIGTGTGLLSLMIRQKNNVLIDAVEIDREAAVQAQENSNATDWADDIQVIHQDVLSWQPGKQWDCIVSNPPFYEKELKSGKKEKDMAHHDDGLQLLSLFSCIKNHLKDDGVFFLLLPAKRETALYDLFEKFHFHAQKIVFIQPTERSADFRLLVKASNKITTTTKNEALAIKNDQNNYSDDFVSLLKDYYLYL